MTGAIIRYGDERQVNIYTAGNQYEPSVTALADGGWLVTWQSEGQDGDGLGIYQQRYDRDGAAVGGEQHVNTYTADSQYQPSVTALADGGWLVTWSSLGQDGSGLGIYQQRYDRNGAAVGGEQHVNTYISANQSSPSVTALADGGWLVTWQSVGQDGSGSGIYQRRYDHNGAAVGDEKHVNTYTSSDQAWPSVTTLADGGWLVTWHSVGQDGSGYGVYQQRYDRDGMAVGDEQQVNTYTNRTQSWPSVTALADGGWLVTWTGQDASGYGIYQQRYDRNGAAIDGEQFVNNHADSDQYYPSVTALADGGWLVTWQSVGKDTSRGGIYQQRYDRDGTAIGDGQQVNIDASGGQSYPSVAALADGDWVVTWNSTGQDGDGGGVYQRRFTPVAAFVQGDDKEHGTGTEGDDVFLVRNGGLNANDSLEAGAGIDTLRMIEAGMIDLTAPALFTGVEIVQGSTGNDIVLADAARLAGIVGFQGGSGTDALHLKTGHYDFSAKVVAGFEAITLLETGSITFADKATALLAHSRTKDGAVILTDDSLTVAERTQLYHQGIRQVTDASGTRTLKEAQASLSTHAVEENAGTGTVVGTLSAIDPTPGDGLRFELIDSAGGRFGLSGNQLVVADGSLLDYETGASHRITVRVVDEGGIATDAAFTITLNDIAVEIIRGTSRADVLTGGTGRDILYGMTGKDTLTGDAGQDVFVFNTKPNKKTNLDRITDFNVKDDAIWLENKVFTKLGKKGTEAKPAALKKDFFTLGSKAKDKNDHVIYDNKKGVLYYDADGSGRGKAVEIATLSKKLKMTHKDFFVI